MRGKLYGVGVGPGDPMLMTLKAVKTIEACPVYGVPGDCKQNSVAYRIAAKVVDFSEKQCLVIDMPMTRDRTKLEAAHRAGAEKIKDVLREGKDVAMLTLGDPVIYSTYLYLHSLITDMGYEAEIINGVPSFCACAARLGISLAEKDEQLHIIPAACQDDKVLKSGGTKVFMKAGSKMSDLKQKLRGEERENGTDIYMVENCGMDGERLSCGVENINEQAGYYSVVICKERRLHEQGHEN